LFDPCFALEDARLWFTRLIMLRVRASLASKKVADNVRHQAERQLSLMQIGDFSSKGRLVALSAFLVPNLRRIQPARKAELPGLGLLDSGEGRGMAVSVWASERIAPPNKSVSAK